jgi:hypothetical protein
MRWLLPVLLVPSIAQAQQPIPCQPPPSTFVCPGNLVCNPSNECVPRDRLRAHSQFYGEPKRDSGIVFTVIGTGAVAVAIALFASSRECGIYPHAVDQTCLNGYFVLLGSLPFLGVGIPFWAQGQKQMNQDANHVQLFITPVDGGAMAGVRLVSF